MVACYAYEFTQQKVSDRYISLKKDIYEISVSGDISTMFSAEKKLEHILGRENVLEYIKFTQENGMDYLAILVDEGDSNQYTIEIYEQNFEKFQTIPISNIGTPRNLRALDLRDIGYTDIVVRVGTHITPYTAYIHGDMWDTSFMWIPEMHTFVSSEISFGVEFTNYDDTRLSAKLIPSRTSYSRVEIYDTYFNKIQGLLLPHWGIIEHRWIRAYDLNRDGYMALLLNAGTSSRRQYTKIFVWDTNLQEFAGVEFVGFSYLTVPRYEDGYIKDVLIDLEHYTVRRFVWEGSRLIKVSEQRHYFRYK